MRLFNKAIFAVLAASSLLLTACQTPSNTLTFTPQAPSTFTSSSQRAVTVNVMGKDMRSQPEISSYIRDNALFKLSASPTVDALFQQVVQQDLNSKGFHIGAPSASNTNVIVNVKDFYAKVDQGNLRYKISAKIQLEINVQGGRGNFTKNLGATRTTEGAFTASNDEIKKVLDEVFKDTVTAIYADQEVANAIRQYAN